MEATQSQARFNLGPDLMKARPGLVVDSLQPCYSCWFCWKYHPQVRLTPRYAPGESTGTDLEMHQNKLHNFKGETTTMIRPKPPHLTPKTHLFSAAKAHSLTLGIVATPSLRLAAFVLMSSVHSARPTELYIWQQSGSTCLMAWH